MKVIFILLLSISLSAVELVAGVEVKEPALIITGHYRSPDGRVKEHKFPVEIKLLSDGKFVGRFESWIEARLTDGSSQLGYMEQSFFGYWEINGDKIHLIVKESDVPLPELVFKEINGLQITLKKEEPRKEGLEGIDKSVP